MIYDGLKENFNATFLDGQDFTATFKESDGLIANFGEVMSIMPDPYEGEYVVTPMVVPQTLPTKKKSMARNVEVEAIPYTEVSNIDGITVIIGG